MSDMNRVCLSGRLTRDAELKFLPSGIAVLEFGLASNKKLKEKEETTFVDVAYFANSAEAISQYMTKGKYVLVSGRLRFESWENDGSRRSKLTVVADTVDFVSTGDRSVETSSEIEAVEAEVPFS